MRFTLDIKPKAKKVIKFTIWDNDSGKIHETQSLKMPRAEMILPVKKHWEGKLKELNKIV